MIFDTLWKAKQERKKLSRTFDPLIAKAQKEKNEEEVQSLLSEFFFERNIINDKINSLESIRIQSEAEDWGIQVPPYQPDSESWEKGFQPNRVFLSTKARHELRHQIREERHQKRAWIKNLIVLVTVLLGTIIAFISAVHSCGEGKE